MTEITEDQKFGMIEAISHLVHRDYEGIGDDFKRLDFIPEEVKHNWRCGELNLTPFRLNSRGNSLEIIPMPCTTSHNGSLGSR